MLKFIKTTPITQFILLKCLIINYFLYFCTNISSQMMKKYFYIIALLFLFCSTTAVAQDSKKTQESTTIDGLSVYPNPVPNGKVYITTKNDEDKEIEIFNVLGKKIFQTILSSRELNVSNLDSGVYILKIKENEITATRKLIIK
jgi:Secretion system C-terminal sorting domain